MSKKYYVTIMLHDRAYGGPEEGGWWYDCYDPHPNPSRRSPGELERKGGYVDAVDQYDESGKFIGERHVFIEIDPLHRNTLKCQRKGLWWQGVRKFRSHASALRWKHRLQGILDKQLNEGRHPIYSVLSEGRFEAYICTSKRELAYGYPLQTPHYE